MTILNQMIEYFLAKYDSYGIIYVYYIYIYIYYWRSKYMFTVFSRV